MLAYASHWILIAVLAQAPSEAALLKAVPADVDLAIRTRGMEASRDDLIAMLRAMDPQWGNMAEGILAAPVGQIRERHGARVVRSPFIIFSRLNEEGFQGGPAPFAAVLPSDDYKGTLKEISGGKDPELKHDDGGYDAFDSPDGNGSWYAAKAPGIVAIGSSKGLIAAIAKGDGKKLDSVLTGPSARTFLGGDVGLYVNAATLTTRYADQIEQARQQLMAAMEQQQAANAGAMQFAKEFYGGLFDSLKYADALTLNLDAAEKGAHLSSFLKVKPDSEAAKSIAAMQTNEASSLGKLPTGEMAYVYMNVDAKTFEKFQGMSLRMLSGGGKPSPEAEKAMADLHGLGRTESTGSSSMQNGMRTLNDIRVDDPRKFMDASVAMLKAMGGGGEQGQVYKDLKIEPGAQTINGISFTHVAGTIDIEKVAEAAGNVPGQAESMKAMFGDGKMNHWLGADGKRLLQVVAPNWEEGRKLLEGYLKGSGGVGETAGFKAIRAEFPQKASFMLIMETQAVVRMYVNLFSKMLNKPDLKVPDDMPKDPSFLGASLTPMSADGYELHFVIPSSVGTVIAKSVVPIIQGLAGGANQ